MVRWLAALGIAATTLALGARPVGAQTADGHVSIAAGGGIAYPLHGDLQFNAPTWHVAVRPNISRLVSFEIAYAEWRHTDKQEYLDIPIPGVNGPVGRIGRLTMKSTQLARTVGWNVILRHAFDRFSIWGGGGPAYMIVGHDFTQTLSGCEGSVTCDSYSNRYRHGGFAVQGAAGLDVAITRRVVAFGQYGFAVPMEDPGSGHLSLTAGGRFVLW